MSCPPRFLGQYHDDESGLHYNLHRYYSPDTASYLTPDPLGLAASPNDHGYVSNPLITADPLGLYEDALGNTVTMDHNVSEFDWSSDEDIAELHGQILDVINHYDKHGVPPEKVL